MEDPTIDEIRANGPDQIFVESGGKTLDGINILVIVSIWRELSQSS